MVLLGVLLVVGTGLIVGVAHAAPSPPQVRPDQATLETAAANGCGAPSCEVTVTVPAGAPDALFVVFDYDGAGPSVGAAGATSETSHLHVLVSTGAPGPTVVLYVYILKSVAAGALHFWDNDSTGYVGISASVWSGLASSPIDLTTQNQTSFATPGGNAHLTSTASDDLGLFVTGSVTGGAETYNATSTAYSAIQGSTSAAGVFIDTALLALNLTTATTYSGPTGLGYGMSPAHGSVWLAFTLKTVSGPPPLVASASASPPSVLLGSSSTISLSITGGTTPYHWTLELNGTHGANVSGIAAVSAPHTFHKSFTALGAGAYSFILNVTDSGVQSATSTAHLTVNGVLGVGLGATPTPTDVGIASTVTLAFFGGAAPITWTLTETGSSANLTSVVSDHFAYTPYVVGTRTLYLNATDSASEHAAATLAITAHPYLASLLSRSPGTIHVHGTSNVSFSFSGGTNPVTWTLEKNGSSANLTGAVPLLGIWAYQFAPAHPGNYTFYLNATDAVGAAASHSVVVRVTAIPGPGPGPAATSLEGFAVLAAIVLVVVVLLVVLSRSVRQRR